MKTKFLKYSIFLIALSCKAAKPDQPSGNKDTNAQEAGKSDSSNACLTSNIALSEPEPLTVPVDQEVIKDIMYWHEERVITTVKVSSLKKFNPVSQANEYEITLENIPQDTKVITLRWLAVDITFYKYEIETMPADRKIVIPYTFDFEGAPFIAIIFTKSITEAFDSDESRWVFVDLDKL